MEETFTFENLPIYAPNGYKYQYFVAEVLDDGGYEMNYEAGGCNRQQKYHNRSL